MIIDIQAIYLTVIVVIFMIILAVITIKKLINTRSRFTNFLMVIEEIIGVITFVFILSLSYKAMENYDVFVQKYGEMKDVFTYISIYFCSSQIVILILISIYRSINKRKKFIKDRRIIK